MSFTFLSPKDRRLVLVHSMFSDIFSISFPKILKILVIDSLSFATYELLLSLSEILRNFHLSLPHVELAHYVPIREAVLPERLEWVAAVPNVELNVCFVARKTLGKDSVLLVSK